MLDAASLRRLRLCIAPPPSRDLSRIGIGITQEAGRPFARHTRRARLDLGTMGERIDFTDGQ
jgi:hypothetical protein